MTSIIKVDNLQNQCGANIISESANVITIGASGDTVTLAAGASQSGFGRSGSVNWDTTAKTTGFTAVSGNGYFCNTTSAAFTVTLPLSPSAGAIVAVADYNGTAGTNVITVGRNSSNINGSAADFTISRNYAAISFVYVDSTAGWRSVDTSDATSVVNQFVSATGGTIATCGNYKIHTFTGPGTFTVNTTGPGSSTVDYLVVAGGGGGGGKTISCNLENGGGGGAGGFRTNYPSGCAGVPVTAIAYPITVGGGGTAGSGSTRPLGRGGSGSISTFSTITSTGGGGGGGCGPAQGAGLSGGSGGGTANWDPSAGGAGNTPPVSPSQGNPGGASAVQANLLGGAGAGGGAGGSGSAGYCYTGGCGGVGTASLITGSSVTRAGGGGGGGQSGGLGGAGGGGAGRNPAGSGNANTGGGGGGAGTTSGSGGAGGSGVVVIRYKFQ